MEAAWAEGGYRLDLEERQVYDLEGVPVAHELNGSTARPR